MIPLKTSYFNHDIICLLAAVLNFSFQSDDDRISDHPSDSKEGGVSIYYKKNISLIRPMTFSSWIIS